MCGATPIENPSLGSEQQASGRPAPGIGSYQDVARTSKGHFWDTAKSASGTWYLPCNDLGDRAEFAY